MFKKRTLLEKLKNQHPYLLDALPEQIRSDGVEVSIEDATLDQIAFAVLALENEVRPISRRMNALRELYDLARKRGALGAHRVGDAFSDEEGRS
ncbi:hypothetical protein TspCOW1_01870 [Thiohalobacter sp. COW1]|uniref:hypothetical protein n=1 Tax=Thiohalobacter sp. COW1 TaxID=2795687 RepID=UPI0019168605|nr:hypothetical protein [Thiohalobacter sp. COW1]BCO30084.1 hypothetical protein TspCOW1_01870 [Thiohalobacter sp. COW1]